MTLLLGKKPEPSFEARLSAAQLARADATASFTLAADELDTSANDLDILIQDATNEIDRLSGIVTAASEDSDRARRVAANLRALIDPRQLTLF